MVNILILFFFQIGSLQGYYLFEHQHIHKRSLSASEEHHSALSSEPQVSVLRCSVDSFVMAPGL
jgi:hypothetical protein